MNLSTELRLAGWLLGIELCLYKEPWAPKPQDSRMRPYLERETWQRYQVSMRSLGWAFLLD